MDIHRLFLSKWKITLLLSITGVVAYFIPSLDNISLIGLLVFVLAGIISSDGALIINYYIDRDIDILMERTNKRASVDDSITPSKVLLVGSVVSTIGVLIGLYFGPWTAFHLAWGVLFYVFGYSMYLKRKSILNTIIGGLASPAPVWAGYAARYEELGLKGDFLGVPLEGWLLGGLVFIWTPSHTWALSTKNVDDYTRAKIPMVPVRYGVEKTGQMTFYWGLSVIIYGIAISWWITNSIIVAVIISLVSLYLFYGLWIFKTRASRVTGNRCFRIHNDWLLITFLVILIAKWIT